MDVPNERLGKLDPQAAVRLIESIIYADARSLVLPPTAISFPHNVNAADGGIDGKVDGARQTGKQGAIKEGLTCYQIKSGNFHPTPSNIHRMLYDQKTLKKKIRECFERKGTFVLALTGYDGPNPEDTVLKKIRQELVGKYNNSKIEVWTQSTIRGFLKNNPAVSLNVLGIDDDSFKSYSDWSKQDDMSKEVELGPEQQKFIDAVRRHLSSSPDKHLRITAEPGIGKTRLVLEALSTEQFSTACIYVDRPSAFLNSRSFSHLLCDDCQGDTYLIVDECDEEYMAEIWNKVKRIPQIRLVTIHNESGVKTKNMLTLQVPPLDNEQIMSILERHGVPSPNRAKYCSLCGQSPRAAHAIGESLRYEPDDIGKVYEERVWDRYIASKTRTDSEEFKTQKTILLWISAFRRMGFAGLYSKEYGLLQKHMAKYENISLGTFTGAVEKFRAMRILQGDRTLYITPKILHLSLWHQWYKQYHNIEPSLPGYKPDKIFKFSPEANMLEWHTDMFWYAKTAGTDIMNDLFAEGGYADTHRLLDSKFGAELFHSLAKADIDRAVDYISRYVHSKTDWELLEFKSGREQVAITLWGAAMKRELFDKIARLLLLLAETDTDGYGRIADIFVSLFVPVSGPSAQTQTPPSERLPLIRKALLSTNPKRRQLALRACDEALKRPISTFVYDDEKLWQDGSPWTPKSKTEISDYYKELLRVLHLRFDYITDEKEGTDIIGVILKRGMNMLADPAVSDTMVSIVEDLYKEHHVDAETVVKAISTHVALIPFRPMPEHFLRGTGKLQDMLIKSEYRLMMRQTVAWNMVHDHRDDPLKSMERVVRQSLDINTLRPELDWLVTREAVHGYDFGYALGRRDGSNLLPAILSAQRQSKSPVADFLAGYLHASFERDVSGWEDTMEEMLQDHDLRALVPELASLSGMTDRVATRLHDIILEGRLEPSVLKPFIYVNAVNELSGPVFEKWVQLLQSGDQKSHQICLDLYWRYYVANMRRMPDSAPDLLLARDVESVASDQTQVSLWCSILERYMEQNPEDVQVLSSALAFTAGNLVGTGAEDVFFDMLCAVAARSREDAWEHVANLLDPMSDSPADLDNSKAHFIANLLDGGTLVDKISLDIICGWIDEAPDRRAQLATYVFPDRIDIAAEMVSRYGRIGRVRETLTSRQAGHNITSYNISKKIEELESFRNKVEDPFVLEWIDECTNALNHKLNKCRTEWKTDR